MLRQIHECLVNSDLTRKFERRFTRWAKGAMGVPDAYGDLLKVIRKEQPVAVLDVGAFHGETVVRFSDEWGGPVYAFEPTPDSAAYLRRRFARTAHVKVQEMGLSNKDGTTRFFLNANPQTNSLLDNDEGNKEAFGPGTQHEESYEVKTVALDRWLAENVPEGPVVIKADMQGAEGMLVEGGKQAFRECVVAFYSEAQIKAMYMGQADFFSLHERLTKEFGYFLHQVYPYMCNAKGEAVQADVLWLKDLRN